jgi:hypothetical protein
VAVAVEADKMAAAVAFELDLVKAVFFKSVESRVADK